MLGAVGDGALDPGLQVAARDVLRAGDVAGVELLGLAHVDEHRAVGGLLARLGGIDLRDLLLDAPLELGA